MLIVDMTTHYIEAQVSFRYNLDQHQKKHLLYH